MSCNLDASWDWPKLPENLQRFEHYAVPRFLRAVTHADPAWADIARSVFEEAITHDFHGLTFSRTRGLQVMFRHELSGLSLCVDWSGWSYLRDAYLTAHPQADFDEWPVSVYHSAPYQELKAWVAEEILRANAWQEARDVAAHLADLALQDERALNTTQDEDDMATAFVEITI